MRLISKHFHPLPYTCSLSYLCHIKSPSLSSFYSSRLFAAQHSANFITPYSRFTHFYSILEKCNQFYCLLQMSLLILVKLSKANNKYKMRWISKKAVKCIYQLNCEDSFYVGNKIRIKNQKAETKYKDDVDCFLQTKDTLCSIWRILIYRLKCGWLLQCRK